MEKSALNETKTANEWKKKIGKFLVLINFDLYKKNKLRFGFMNLKL